MRLIESVQDFDNEDAVIVAASGDYGKPLSVCQDRLSRQIGRPGDDEMQRLNLALAFALGLSD